MANQDTRVSVCMLAYNVAPYIGEAIEGVLQQKTDFSIELVIGEDCSTDDTRRICEAYATRYPDVVRVTPPEANLGIAGNAARTLARCRGTYIAICDGDDVWNDPHKLQQQVDFLEQNPDYGVVYTDVQTISETGQPIEDEEHASIRGQYASGAIFFKLLQGNFINNSTAVFRSRFLLDYEIDRDRNYYTHDHLLWLYIAAQAKIHFINAPTTRYRKHTGGVTRSTAKLENNKKKFQYHLYDILLNFDKHNRNPVSTEDRLLFFRKILSVLIRKENNAAMKLNILGLAPKYFPGMLGLTRIMFSKIGFHFFPAINENVLTTKLE